MLDYVVLGMMKAEFEEACRIIDSRADGAEKNILRDAWDALLDGDTLERDRVLAKHGDITDARNKAKMEAWLRIGEKHGISRDEAASYLKRIAH